MEAAGIVKDGKVEFTSSVRLPEGARVRVVVEEGTSVIPQSLETEPLSEASVLADIAWATGRQFDS